MNDFVIISYATKGAYEEILLSKLKASIDRLEPKVKFEYSIIDSLGSWYNNTAYKSKFMLDKMLELKTNIVWVDADASILSYPLLFNNIPSDIDIALHYLDWSVHYYHHTEKHLELLSGTIYLPYSDKSIDLLTHWYSLAKNTTIWEQKILEAYLKDNSNIKALDLPREYCYIETVPDGRTSKTIIEAPIIVHHQASRTFKRK